MCGKWSCVHQWAVGKGVCVRLRVVGFVFLAEGTVKV